MRFMALVVGLALCGAMVGISACGDGENDSGGDSGTDTDSLMYVQSWINLVGEDAFVSVGLRVDELGGASISGATVEVNGTNIPETGFAGNYALYGFVEIAAGASITLAVIHDSFGTVIATGTMPEADTLTTPAEAAVIPGTTSSWDVIWTTPYTADSSTTGNQVAIATSTDMAVITLESATTTTSTIEAGAVAAAGEYRLVVSAYRLLALVGAAGASRVLASNATNVADITIN